MRSSHCNAQMCGKNLLDLRQCVRVLYLCVFALRLTPGLEFIRLTMGIVSISLG